MTFKQRLQKFRSRFQHKPIWQNKDGLTIVPAFVCGGVQYYEVPGFASIPYKRGLEAVSVFEEVEMRITKERLQAYVASVENILSAPEKINIMELSILTKNLKDRLDWIISPDTIYKLASVVYFDDNESPDAYNALYGQRKIAHWKKHDMDTFFLQKHIGKYIPLLQQSDKDFLTYMQEQMKLEDKELKILLELTCKSHSTKDFYQILKLQEDLVNSMQ